MFTFDTHASMFWKYFLWYSFTFTHIATTFNGIFAVKFGKKRHFHEHVTPSIVLSNQYRFTRWLCCGTYNIWEHAKLLIEFKRWWIDVWTSPSVSEFEVLKQLYPFLIQKHKNGTNYIPAWHADIRVGSRQCNPIV